MKETTDIDQDRLHKLWKTYINNSSLFTKTTFAKYAHDRVMKPGWCWPKLYYSGQEAWTLLHNLIHNNETDGIRRVL